MQNTKRLFDAEMKSKIKTDLYSSFEDNCYFRTYTKEWSHFSVESCQLSKTPLGYVKLAKPTNILSGTESTNVTRVEGWHGLFPMIFLFRSTPTATFSK